ncbi:ligand-gated ion channel 4-like, partial [Saccostrea cucullata]|uniref:ligand-gated ion channel 4-like n=1 Tax=Saccostrea cuccullata TaxID=36930 RepID=UPI002ED3523D
MALCDVTFSSRYELRKDLLKNYEKGLLPNDTATVVTVNFNAFRLIEFDDRNGKFTISGYLEVHWIDLRIAENWNLSSHQSPDIPSMYFKESEVWTPNVLQINPYSRSDSEKLKDESVMFLPTGSALMLKGDIFSSECKADFTYFPHDTQHCSIELVVWGYYMEEVILYPYHNKVNMDNYKKNNLWDMEDTRISLNILNTNKDSSKIRVLKIEFIINRRSTYYVLFLIMPIVLMEILQVFVFMLPWDCGERASYSITVLLSIAVYLTIITEQIPKSSEPNISVVAKKLFTDLCIGCVVQIFVIISLHIYNFSQLKHQAITQTCCRDMLIWAQKKDWIAIGHRLDITFVVITVAAIFAANAYLLSNI